MKDPFEDFLEDALGGPDLELGHEMRRRLLEAAVAGESISDNNIVRIDRPDPAETAGFDWLVGEAPATESLMGRMIEDPEFMESLDRQRGFILTLRESLRRRAAAAVVPVRRRRWVPAAILSAAAALAVTTGIVFFKPASDPALLVAAAEETAAPAAAAPVLRPPVMAITAPKMDSPDTPPTAPASVPLATEVAAASPPAPADLGGTGRSIEAEDPALVAQLEMALGAGEGDSDLPEPIAAMLGDVDSVTEGFGEDADSLPLLAGGLNSGSGDGFGGPGLAGTGPGISLTGPGGGKDRETIPEPGGALPVMIGLMLLLLKRPQRRQAEA